MPFELKFEPWPAEKPSFRFAPVPWDSEVLEIPVFELAAIDAASGPDVAPALATWLAGRAAAGKCLVYTRSEWGDVPTAVLLARAGFYPVESTVELSISLTRLTQPFGTGRGARVRPASEADLPSIGEIARTAFRADRYHLDPHVRSEKAAERFVRWVEQAFGGGDIVLVYEGPGGGELLGFFHVRPSTPRSADLSLAAVSSTLRGSGLGAWMYQEVLRICRERGFERAFTRVSVANVDVVNLYARLGFTQTASRATWHWFAGE